MKYVLRVPDFVPARYIAFMMMEDTKPGWYLGYFPEYSAQFDTREKAQECIDRWAASSSPLPTDLEIEEYSDGV